MPRMLRRTLLFSIAAVAFCALVLPGNNRDDVAPALAQDANPEYRLVAPALAKDVPAEDVDETALAESLLLTPSAFEDWQQVSFDEVVNIEQCEPGLPADATGEAVTDAYASSATGAGAYQYLRVYRDNGAASGFATAMTPAVQCLVDEINAGEAGSDQVQVTDGSLEPLEVVAPEADVELTAYRISGEARATVNGLKVEFDYTWDIIVVVQGRVAFALHLQGVVNPVDSEVRDRLLDAAVERIEQDLD